MVRSSRRGGVPVFMRPTVKPSCASCSVMPLAGGSETRPPGVCTLPTCIRPLRKVPAVRITALALKVSPRAVLTPFTTPPSITNSSTESCHMYKLGVFSSTFLHSRMNCWRSLCERGLHIAGPLLRLSILNWMLERSVTIPIWPPRASISRTICPLAMPPTAGLQLICAILFMSIVISRVCEPNRAAALAASQPAWPAPTTMTS